MSQCDCLPVSSTPLFSASVPIRQTAVATPVTASTGHTNTGQAHLTVTQPGRTNRDQAHSGTDPSLWLWPAMTSFTARPVSALIHLMWTAIKELRKGFVLLTQSYLVCPTMKTSVLSLVFIKGVITEIKRSRSCCNVYAHLALPFYSPVACSKYFFPPAAVSISQHRSALLTIYVMSEPGYKSLLNEQTFWDCTFILAHVTWSTREAMLVFTSEAMRFIFHYHLAPHVMGILFLFFLICELLLPFW